MPSVQSFPVAFIGYLDSPAQHIVLGKVVATFVGGADEVKFYPSSPAFCDRFNTSNAAHQ